MSITIEESILHAEQAAFRVYLEHIGGRENDTAHKGYLPTPPQSVSEWALFVGGAGTGQNMASLAGPTPLYGCLVFAARLVWQGKDRDDGLRFAGKALAAQSNTANLRNVANIQRCIPSDLPSEPDEVQVGDDQGRVYLYWQVTFPLSMVISTSTDS